MKECEKFQIMLLEAPESPEVAAHLAQCPECAAFAEFERKAMAVRTETPESPDFSTVMAAWRSRGGRRRGVGRPLILWLGGAAAALFAMSAVTVSLELPDTGKMTADGLTPPTVATAAHGQTGTQSVVEALNFSWDNNAVYALENDFEAMTVACNWNIPQDDSMESEVLK